MKNAKDLANMIRLIDSINFHTKGLTRQSKRMEKDGVFIKAQYEYIKHIEKKVEILRHRILLYTEYD